MASLVQLLFVTCSCLAAIVGAENVTTVFQLQETSDGSFDTAGRWIVVARGSARGLPIIKEHQGLDNVWAGLPCCQSWTRDNWVKLDQTEARAMNPPLVVDSFESTTLGVAEASSMEPIEQDNEKVWRAAFPPSSRARLIFDPPQSGRAALGIFLCEPETIANFQCVAVVVTGSSEDGRLLRFQTTRYGTRQNGPRRQTPNGFMKTFVQYRDDRVREGWLGTDTYYFHIERSSEGNLEVRLEQGDSTQRRTMSIPAEMSYTRLAISLLTQTSPAGRFEAKHDPAWYGELAPGKTVQVNFKPAGNGIGHLGFSFCEDRFQDLCTSVIFDGFSNGRAKVASSPYWTAGSEDFLRPMPAESRNARWEPVEQRKFSVSRGQDGNVRITISGDSQVHTLALPPTQLASYQYLVIESHDDRGTMEVIPQKESLSADVWQLTGSEGVLRSPAIPEWFVQSNICISLAARIAKGSSVVVTIQRVADGEGKRVAMVRGTDDDPQWIKKRLLLGRSLVLQNQKVQIVMEARQPAGTRKPMLLQWLAACNPDDEEDRVSVHRLPPVSGLTVSRGFKSIESTGLQSLPNLNGTVCANEGVLQLEKGRCLCRPGFTGMLCEKGCGRNRFGEDCASKCSQDSSARQCRGMWLCTADLPCDCAPGMKGPQCDQFCEHGFYGVGCRQTCGQCAFDQTCDPYTGWCTTGCKGGLQPPFCKEACGSAKKVTSLIVHGAEVAAEKYPWNVAVFDKLYKEPGSKSNDTRVENICGGTTITPTIVLSAAHCFHNEKSPPQKQPASKYQVAFGKTLRGWDAKEEHNERIQRRNVLVIHTPEFYSGFTRSFEDDLAVLELDAPLAFTEYVSPICLDYTGGFQNHLSNGAVGKVAGWGNTDGGRPSEVLKDATLPFISQNDCLKLVPFSFRPYASARDKFCAGEQGAYVDRGDSGGGLVFADTRSGAWYLRGIVSVRPPDILYYAAYTNASYHRDYILNIKQLSELRNAQVRYWSQTLGT